MFRGQPVLVDFADSILSREELVVRDGPVRSGGDGADAGAPRGARSPAPASSPKGRNHRLKRWIKDRVLRPSAVAASARNASVLLREVAKPQGERPKILVVGGGARGIGMEVLYESPDVDLVSFDIYASPLTQFVADGHSVPLATGSVDAVWIQYVLEHVLDPARVVAEIHRVLAPGGLVFSETPFLQHLHGEAYDFTRFTHSGHRWLFRHFEELDSGVAMGPGVHLLWTVEHLMRGVFRSPAAGKGAKLLAAWLQWADLAIGSDYQRDSASSFYFLGRRADQPLHPRDMVTYGTRGVPRPAQGS